MQKRVADRSKTVCKASREREATMWGRAGISGPLDGSEEPLEPFLVTWRLDEEDLHEWVLRGPEHLTQQFSGLIDRYREAFGVVSWFRLMPPSRCHQRRKYLARREAMDCLALMKRLYPLTPGLRCGLAYERRAARDYAGMYLADQHRRIG